MSEKRGVIIYRDYFKSFLDSGILLNNYGAVKQQFYRVFYDITVINNKIRLPAKYVTDVNLPTNGGFLYNLSGFLNNYTSDLCIGFFRYSDTNFKIVDDLNVYSITDFNFISQSLCELSFEKSISTLFQHRVEDENGNTLIYGNSNPLQITGNINQCKFIPTVCKNALYDTQRNFNASERISKRQPDLSNFVYEEIALNIFKNESESYKAGAIVSATKNLGYIMRQPESGAEPLHWDEIPDATGTTITDGQYATNYYYFTIPAFIGLLARCFNYDYFACIKSVSVFPIYSDVFPYEGGETGFTKIGGAITTTQILETELNLFALTNNNGETTFCKSFNAFRDSEFRFTDISGTQHSFPLLNWDSFKNSLFGEINCKILLGFNPITCTYTYTPCDYNGQEFNYAESFSVNVALGGDYFSNNLMKYLKKASQDFISGQVAHANGLSQFDLVYLDGVSVSNGNASLYSEGLSNITSAVAGFVEPLRKFTQFYAPADTYLSTVQPENLVNATYYAVASLLEILDSYDLTSAYKSNFRTALLQAKDSLGTIFNIPSANNIPSYSVEGAAIFGQTALYCPTRYSLLCFYDTASFFGLPCDIFFNGELHDFLNREGLQNQYTYPSNAQQTNAPDYFPFNFIRMSTIKINSSTFGLYNTFKRFYEELAQRFVEGLLVVDIQQSNEYKDTSPYFLAPNTPESLATPYSIFTDSDSQKFPQTMIDMLKSYTYCGSAYDGINIPSNINFL